MAGELSWLERGTHKPEGSGSIPLPATILDDWSKIASHRRQFNSIMPIEAVSSKNRYNFLPLKIISLTLS